MAIRSQNAITSTKCTPTEFIILIRITTIYRWWRHSPIRAR